MLYGTRVRRKTDAIKTFFAGTIKTFSGMIFNAKPFIILTIFSAQLRRYLFIRINLTS